MIDKKRKRLKWLEDRALPKAEHYRDKAKENLKLAERELATWGTSYDEITEEIEELETEIELLEEVGVDKDSEPPVGSWSDDRMDDF